MNPKASILLACCATISASALAAPASFLVTDNTGAPLPHAVVALVPTSPGAKQTANTIPAKPAVMAQREKQFDPHVVAVQKGQKVEFPNQDSIKHQVYSLTDIQEFDFLVESGKTSSGPAMHTKGKITLGCNIHDWMLAYIYVTDTPFFGTTDSEGKVTVDLPDGETFQWQVMHPRIPEDQFLSGDISTPLSKTLNVNLTMDLLPGYDEADDFDDFDDY